MRPFFPYFGAKFKLARILGRPRHERVIEPSAGSAGFSCYWEPPRVTLVERDPVIYGVWSYLIKVRPPEIMKLPSNIDSLDELPPWVPEEARNLTGLWFNRALPQPAKH